MIGSGFRAGKMNGHVTSGGAAGRAWRRSEGSKVQPTSGEKTRAAASFQAFQAYVGVRTLPCGGRPD
jgi:hypothetical protein